jgi:hypothetical protein
MMESKTMDQQHIDPAELVSYVTHTPVMSQKKYVPAFLKVESNIAVSSVKLKISGMS